MTGDAALPEGRYDSSHCPVRACFRRCAGRGFLRDFPKVEAAKADSLDSLARALDGAEIFHVYNAAFTAKFARVVRDQGRALKWKQFTTVGIEIGLRAGLPEGVWVTNSGDVSHRALATHAMALMLGVMRRFRRFGQLQARREWPPRQSMSSQLLDPDSARMRRVLPRMSSLMRNLVFLELSRHFDE